MKVLIPFLAIYLLAITVPARTQTIIIPSGPNYEAMRQDEEKKAAKQRILDAHRDYLGKYVADVDHQDIARLSDNDLQRLYRKAYEKQGMSERQAKEECQRVSLSRMPPETPAIEPVSSPTPSQVMQYAKANEIRRKSNEEAVKEYPDVTNPDSPIAKKYLEIVAKLKATGNPLLSDPNSPLKISQMAGNELGIAPK